MCLTYVQKLWTLLHGNPLFDNKTIIFVYEIFACTLNYINRSAYYHD